MDLGKGLRSANMEVLLPQISETLEHFVGCGGGGGDRKTFTQQMF